MTAHTICLYVPHCVLTPVSHVRFLCGCWDTLGVIGGHGLGHLLGGCTGGWRGLRLQQQNPGEWGAKVWAVVWWFCLLSGQLLRSFLPQEGTSFECRRADYLLGTGWREQGMHWCCTNTPKCSETRNLLEGNLCRQLKKKTKWKLPPITNKKAPLPLHHPPPNFQKDQANVSVDWSQNVPSCSAGRHLVMWS